VTIRQSIHALRSLWGTKLDMFSLAYSELSKTVEMSVNGWISPCSWISRESVWRRLSQLVYTKNSEWLQTPFLEVRNRREKSQMLPWSPRSRCRQASKTPTTTHLCPFHPRLYLKFFCKNLYLGSSKYHLTQSLRMWISYEIMAESGGNNSWLRPR
jgi:hypothetical protein